MAEAWEATDASHIIKIYKSFCPRAEAVITVNGGYIVWERCGDMWLTVANHRLFLVLNCYGLASFVSGSTEKGQNFLRTLYSMTVGEPRYIHWVGPGERMV